MEINIGITNLRMISKAILSKFLMTLVLIQVSTMRGLIQSMQGCSELSGLRTMKL